MVTSFAWPRTLSLLAIAQVFLFCQVVHAKLDTLFTSSITYCAPPEAILIQEFSIIYFAANESVSFNISAASVQPNLRVRANIFLNVYGMQPVNVTQDFCTAFGDVLCPLPMYNFTGSSSIPLPSSINVASKVPNIAYKIPDLEAFAQLTLTDVQTGNVAACIQATLSNGWSAHQSAVSLTTGGFAIFALISALLHSLLPSLPISPASLIDIPSIAPTRFIDLVLLFQQISLSGLLHLNLPLVYRAFTINFAWALGLFSDSKPIQDAIDRMRHLTGSTSSDGVQSPTAFVNRQLSPYNVPTLFVIANSTQGLLTRDSSTDSSAGMGPPATVTKGGPDVLPAGIPVYVNSLEIGTTNALASVFFTVLIGVVVGAGVLGLLHVALTFAVTRGKGNGWAWADVMHAEFRWFATSNGLRYAMVILYPVLIFSFFQWTLHDSWLAVLLSVIMVLSTLAALLYPAVQTMLIARRQSSEALYSIPCFSRTIGAFYVPFRQERYYYFIVPLGAAVIKSCFIGFAKGNGLTQVTALLLIEMAVFISSCVLRPYRSRGGDVLALYLGVTRVAAAALMFPFVEKFQIKAIPRVAVGLVIMVMFGIAVVVMCINVVFNFGDGLLWRRRTGKATEGVCTDLEKCGALSVQLPLEPPPALGQRPKNPTPTTSFSQDPSAHSRHMPMMSAAVSPNYTIPSFYTSEDENNVLDDKEHGPPPPCSAPSPSQRSSFFTISSSQPTTPRDDRVSSPPAHKLESRISHTPGQ